MKKQFNFHSPQSWNELLHWAQARRAKGPSKALLQVYAILMTNTSHFLEPDMELPQKRFAITKTLLNLEDQFIIDWEQDCIEEAGDRELGQEQFLSEFKELTDKVTSFLLTDINADPDNPEAPRQFQITLGLTECPYPTLSGARKVPLYAPADQLENVSLYELATAFSIFETFMDTGEEEQAIELIATLYRYPKPQNRHNIDTDYEGDIRLPYLKGETTVQKRKPAIRKLPKLTRQIIIFWFASCRHQLIEEHPLIFTKGEAGDNDSSDYGWAGVLFSLAGGLSDLDTVGQQPAQTALTYLSFLESQRQKREVKAALHHV